MMITAKDIITVDITAQEVDFCKNNPEPGCTRRSTGQIKAIGNLVVRKALGMSLDELNQQAEDIATHHVACVCPLRGQRTVGIAATASVIHDDNILTKQVIVPANQLYWQGLDAHYTVAVYLRGRTDANKEIVSVDQAYVAGWIKTADLKRWSEKGGRGAFRVEHASLAVAPCDVSLLPISTLKAEMAWKKFEV